MADFNSQLQYLLDHIDIVSVVNDYIALKRTGGSFKALCPFHDEKTPSFVVSEQKQIFHCFGCGVGGNAITFVMKIETIEFIDALRLLQERFHVDISFTNDKKKSLSQNEYVSLNEKVSALYKKNLVNAEKVQRYLKQRGLEAHDIELFELGYAPDSWQFITNHLKSDKDALKRAEALGLILRGKEKQCYDYFRNRLLFPIKNRIGQVIGFGGRVLDDGMPKYLNSRDSVLYNKSATLFGIDKAKKEIVQKDRVIITEGYFDVITLHRFGFTHAVALSGTALTSEQIKILKRFTKNILFLLDGDTPGINAMLRSLPLIIQHEVEAKICILPENHDADSFLIKYGKEAFHEHITKARDLFDYYIEMHVQKNPSVNGKSVLAKNIIDIVEASSNPVMIDLYLQKTAHLLGIEPKALRSLLKNSGKKPSTLYAEKTPHKKDLPIPPLEKMFTKIALYSRDYLEKLVASGIVSYFSSEELKNVITYLHTQKKENYSLSSLVREDTPNALRACITELSLDDHEITSETIDTLYNASIIKFRKNLEGKESKKLLTALEEAEKRKDEKLIQELLVKKQQFINKLVSK